jgi:flagellar biosynthesis/type III secretory pathway M-ring protein FliF/YscJ
VYKQTPGTDWYGWGVKILVLGAMAAGVFLIRSLLNRIHVNLPQASMEQLSEAISGATAAIRAKKDVPELPPIEDEVSTEALMRAQRRDRVSEYIREKPGETSRLLKVWLAED